MNILMMILFIFQIVFDIKIMIMITMNKLILKVLELVLQINLPNKFYRKYLMMINLKLVGKKILTKRLL